MTTLPRHRTPSERRAHQSAQQAITRAWAHTRPAPPPPAQDDDQALSQQHPYVTPARARAIREEIQDSHR